MSTLREIGITEFMAIIPHWAPSRQLLPSNISLGRGPCFRAQQQAASGIERRWKSFLGTYFVRLISDASSWRNGSHVNRNLITPTVSDSNAFRTFGQVS